jgi:hypothetical protein
MYIGDSLAGGEMKENNKLFFIVFTSAFIAVIFYLFHIYEDFNGNPFVKMRIKKTAEKYISEKYKNNNLKIDFVGYDYKIRNYKTRVQSQKSIDTQFMLLFSKTGKLVEDRFYYVQNGYSTLSRLDKEYNKLVKDSLDSSFPFNKKDYFITGSFVKKFENDYASPHQINPRSLTVDKKYDIAALAKNAGNLSISIYTDDVSYETMAKIVLDTKKYFDKKKVPFYYMDIAIYVGSSRNFNEKMKSLYVFDFVYSDIYEKDLAKRLKKHAEKNNNNKNTYSNH